MEEEKNYDDVRSQFGSSSASGINEDNKNILAKIRAILEHADRPDSNEQEKETARKKAEAMMAKYRIDRAMLGESHTDNMMRDFMYDFNWYKGEHGSSLWSLFLEIASHCQVKVVHWKAYHGAPDVPIVGTQGDRDYFDMLFTSVMVEFMKGLEPRPDPNRSMIENLVALKEAGQQWLRIAEQLHGIGQLTDKQFNPEFIDIQGIVGFGHEAVVAWRKENNTERDARKKKQVHHLNFSGQYTNYCRANDRPRMRVTPKIYQRSFSAGFIGRMWERLRDLRKHAKSTLSDQESSGLELVMSSNSDRANHYAIEKFGKPPERRGGGGGRRSTLKYDRSAMNEGERAANRVDLQNAKGVDTGKGQLPR